MVPLLVLWGGYGQRDAHAVSLGAIIPISAAGVITFGAAGEVRSEGGAGARGWVDRRARRSAPACWPVRRSAQLKLALRRRSCCSSQRSWRSAGEQRSAVRAGLVAVGAATGVLAGLLGVGGGILLVPFLVLAVGMTQHDAEATSLLVILPTALVAASALRRRDVGDLAGRARSRRSRCGRCGRRRPARACARRGRAASVSLPSCSPSSASVSSEMARASGSMSDGACGAARRIVRSSTGSRARSRRRS